jgi:hypothetical protein
MTRDASTSRTVTYLIFAFFLALCANRAEAQMFCVYDPLGASGDFFSLAKDYQLAAKRWHVDLDTRAYSDEGVAVADFRAGKCDMLNMIGFRAKEFNFFTGSLDAVGALENYTELHDTLNVLASPKLARYMISGDYETVGILPLGAAYPFVKDRSINSLSKVTGKRIAVLDFDKTEAMFVEEVGAIPVQSNLLSFGTKFNNGEVDAIVAPIALYKPLELDRGLGNNGGIIRRTAVQITLQFMIRHDRFPPEFGQHSRFYMATQVDHALSIIRNMENDVDARQWMYVLSSERTKFYKIMRTSRNHMTQAGYFDRRMLAILKRVRCRNHDEEEECSLPDE